MQEVVANVDSHIFDIEHALESQLGAQQLPFPGMDKSGAAVCTYFLRSLCSKGTACPFRHLKGDRSVVCKHWLRGLCKKGDDCEFLHEYDMSKMPECYFFSKFGQCSNKECPFLHIDPEKKMKDCPWYDRGFCRHGPNCKNRHVRRILCINYLLGFCLDGSKCKFVHVRFEIPKPEDYQTGKKGTSIICHFCNEPGHKVYQCPKMMGVSGIETTTTQEPVTTSQTTQATSQPQQHIFHPFRPKASGNQQLRPLDEVTCFKCGEKGHYANKCPKGHLAFLSAGAGGQKPGDVGGSG